MLQHLVVGPP